MIEEELHELIRKVQRQGCEGQTMEIKAARRGCPEKLYDTISAFSNQDQGGTLLFGLDESNDFAKVGVYDAQALQKKIMEYCLQMTPIVRPVMTVCDEDGKVFVSAEIPPIDVADRPCFKTSQGRLKGAYVRLGDADTPMTEYEVYSYEAFRKKYRDDIRPVEGVGMNMLDTDALEQYMEKARKDRPHLARVPEAQQYELMGITQGENITRAGLFMFGLFPQGYYPCLCITATRVPGTEIGMVDEFGHRFLDSKRIEGTIPEMLEATLEFVEKNMRMAMGLDPHTGRRVDDPEYPMEAVREAVLNALVHRDYSMHTEGMPIEVNMYEDRMEILNPGGLYGRLTVDKLGHAQPDTRNPALVRAMELLGATENRHSGIPTIRRAMEQRRLRPPVFINRYGGFKVVLYNDFDPPPMDFMAAEEEHPYGEDTPPYPAAPVAPVRKPAPPAVGDEKQLLEFCRTPRTRAEIVAYLNIASAAYALRRYLDPLLQSGAIRMTIPERPRCHSQRFVTAERW